MPSAMGSLSQMRPKLLSNSSDTQSPEKRCTAGGRQQHQGHAGSGGYMRDMQFHILMVLSEALLPRILVALLRVRVVHCPSSYREVIDGSRWKHWQLAGHVRSSRFA
jgi:hypothetical protein